MSLPGYVPGMPRIGTKYTATHRIVFRDGQFASDYSGGKIISGACSRDPGNTNDIDVLRPGLLMGKIVSVVNSLGTAGDYAPSILGVTTAAYTAGGTTLTTGSAVVTELLRRCGATGTFRIVGPPAANGAVAEEAVTYSAGSGTSITITALVNSYVSGSFIMPDDGSEDILTVIPDGYGKKVTDIDNSTSLRVPFSDLPVAGCIKATQLLPAWPSDTSLRQWIISEMSRSGAGKFVFDNVF